MHGRFLLNCIDGEIWKVPCDNPVKKLKPRPFKFFPEHRLPVHSTNHSAAPPRCAFWFVEGYEKPVLRRTEKSEIILASGSGDYKYRNSGPLIVFENMGLG